MSQWNKRQLCLDSFEDKASLKMVAMLQILQYILLIVNMMLYATPQRCRYGVKSIMVNSIGYLCHQLERTIYGI